jgi:hypothetical protein
VLPASDPQLPRTPGTPLDDGAPVKPIGPERLRALREAILAGTYPLDAAAHSGLATMLAGAATAPKPGGPAATAKRPAAAPKKPADPR